MGGSCPKETLVFRSVLGALESQFVSAIYKRNGKPKKADIVNFTQRVGETHKSGNSLLHSVTGSKKLDLLVMSDG
jgi:hypothetical protein